MKARGHGREGVRSWRGRRRTYPGNRFRWRAKDATNRSALQHSCAGSHWWHEGPAARAVNPDTGDGSPGMVAWISCRLFSTRGNANDRWTQKRITRTKRQGTGVEPDIQVSAGERWRRLGACR